MFVCRDTQTFKLKKMATRRGFQRLPLLFFSTLEKLIESDFTSTNEKMLPIVSKFFRMKMDISVSFSSLTQQHRYFGGPFSSLSRGSKSTSKRTTSRQC